MKPHQTDIAKLNREVVTFVDQCLSGPLDAKWFGGDHTPFRFHFAYLEKGQVVLNSVRLEYGWEGHGIFTKLIRHLSAKKDIVQIGVKSAQTPEIQNRLRKLRFVEHDDNDFILLTKEICQPRAIP